MAGKKLGTFTIKDGSKTTTYPVHRAGFGVQKYNDTNEIWFDVAARIAGDEPSLYDEYELHMDATIYSDNIEVSDLSGRMLTIPGPSETLERTCAEAHLYYTAAYSDPELVGPCTIRIGEKRDDVYPVHWEGMLDEYNGSEIEVKADFRLSPVKQIPCSLSYILNRPFHRWMYILLPVCGVAGYIASKSIDRLPGWVGVVIGIFIATYIARKIDERWQRRVRELQVGGQGAGRAAFRAAGDEQAAAGADPPD